MSETLQKYYDYTNKAEYAIVISNDKKAASEYYQNAFKLKKQPFFDDIYNSFIVNTEIHNNERAKKDYKNLRCLGYNFSTIRGFKFFKDFMENNQDFINGIDCTQEQSKFNYILKKTLDSLGKSDQYLGRLTVPFSTKRPDEALIKKLNKNDSLNAVKLKEVIEKYGFPNEYMVGVNNQVDAFTPDYQLIIIHQQKKGKEINVDLVPLLYKAVLEGKLRNRNFVDLTEHATLKKDYNLPLIGLDSEYYINKSIYPESRDKKDKKEIDRIEENRKKIGLPDVSKTTLYRLFKVNFNPLYRFEPTSFIQYFTESCGEQILNNITNNAVKLTFEDYLKYLNDKNNNRK
ncbi:hypothetical protein ACM39_13420 [Chryseobacterium sp. FH2]|nr:hypothetical protein ACM39_13420 [Chryseobacterium sp. FH2]